MSNPFLAEGEYEASEPWGGITTRPAAPQPVPSRSNYAPDASAGKSAREIELERREEALRFREAKLVERERAIVDMRPNWPKFKSITTYKRYRQDSQAIDLFPRRPDTYIPTSAPPSRRATHPLPSLPNPRTDPQDIPESGQWLVKRLFLAWHLAVLTYVINCIACFTVLVTKGEQGGSMFGVSLLIMAIGIPVSFVFWYRPIYTGVKHDRSISFFFFFVNYSFHIGVAVLLGIGIPGWGGSCLAPKYSFDFSTTLDKNQPQKSERFEAPTNAVVPRNGSPQDPRPPASP
ncbi:scamp family-domain-containing protein [Blyttiomyces helicus]|uniref:Scamp family-domain-containing protein n=1 Tax=Blyttiomyces helicus TaxID=388810 RepID=A0A4P9VXF3_9FUNG|nr:scamp family-domain-containing protein [Blyttiomyces helicus]|eukprot:RKO83585.1 scamp family-domain-containing protein [Blyttiomyces helicus]